MPSVLVETQDRHEIAAFLQGDPTRYLYELGDLEDPHWSRARWFAVKASSGAIEAMALLYDAKPIPALWVMGSGSDADRRLLAELGPRLPRPVYAQIAEPLMTAFQSFHPHVDPVLHLRMELVERKNLESVPVPAGFDSRRLQRADLIRLENFYNGVYPGHWFVPEMLFEGHYVGAFLNERLVSVAGTHLASRRQGIAALGNIATEAQYHGLGLATFVTASLCRTLLADIPHVGLNVRADNLAAIRCYEKIGFRARFRFGAFNYG